MSIKIYLSNIIHNNIFIITAVVGTYPVLFFDLRRENLIKLIIFRLLLATVVNIRTVSLTRE